MTEPRVVDLRGGLTAEFLDGLRRADRVLLALKNAETAVLGYWVENELTTGLMSSAVTRVVMVPHRFDVPILGPLASVSPRESHGVVLDIAQPREDEFWGRVVGMLRVGDTLRVTHDAEASRRAALQISYKGERVASVRLPQPPAQKRSAA